MRLFAILYALAMTATAVAVLLGCAVTDPKMGQEFLPVLFMPQILFSGLFIPTGFIPIWLRYVDTSCGNHFHVSRSHKFLSRTMKLGPISLLFDLLGPPGSFI
jgi:ABC-type multidrug transport system permease subunit